MTTSNPGSPDRTTALTWVGDGAPSSSPEMDHRFDLQPPRSPEAADLMDRVRASFKALAVGLEAALPDCRERSTAITKLEEGLYWAIGAVARNQ